MNLMMAKNEKLLLLRQFKEKNEAKLTIKIENLAKEVQNMQEKLDRLEVEVMSGSYNKTTSVAFVTFST